MNRSVATAKKAVVSAAHQLETSNQNSRDQCVDKDLSLRHEVTGISDPDGGTWDAERVGNGREPSHDTTQMSGRLSDRFLPELSHQVRRSNILKLWVLDFAAAKP